MVSDLMQSKVRRAINKSNRGKKRKNYIKNHGTTPKSLELNRPNANEIAQKTPSS